VFVCVHVKDGIGWFGGVFSLSFQNHCRSYFSFSKSKHQNKKQIYLYKKLLF